MYSITLSREYWSHTDGMRRVELRPSEALIIDYKAAVYWIQSQVQSNSKYLTDDTRILDACSPNLGSAATRVRGSAVG